MQLLRQFSNGCAMQLGSDNSEPKSVVKSFSHHEWQHERASHRLALNPWVSDRLSRANLDIPHPVYDFLFTYYSFPPARLLRWSPGVDSPVASDNVSTLDWSTYYKKHALGWVIPRDSFPSHRKNYLNWAARYLTETGERPPFFGCFGLHEWAMLYKAPSPRHKAVPLRVSPNDIETVVDSLQLRCTHYDAFRFFTPSARPLNRNNLTRITTTQHDQPACIHASMDLYRFAYKIAPFCPSSILQEAFLLAVKARTIDMQASPYDLSEYGLKAIAIETPSGREAYIEHQRDLFRLAKPIRDKLLSVYRYLTESP